MRTRTVAVSKNPEWFLCIACPCDEGRCINWSFCLLSWCFDRRNKTAWKQILCCEGNQARCLCVCCNCFLLFPWKEQQHERPDAFCCWGHSPQPPVVSAREWAQRRAGELGPRRVFHEAFSSVQVPPRQAQSNDARHQKQWLSASSP